MQVNITLRKIENPKAGVDSVYAAGVQHDATLNAEESAPSISAYLKVPFKNNFIIVKRFQRAKRR